MKKTGIAEFKAHLAHFLRMVKSGINVEIHDRGTPVAILTKMQSQVELVITPPLKKKEFLKGFKSRFKKAQKIDIDSILQIDRNQR